MKSVITNESQGDALQSPSQESLNPLLLEVLGEILPLAKDFNSELTLTDIGMDPCF